MTNKDKLLQKKNNIFSQSKQVGYKNGIEIEKGVILNEDYLISNEASIGDVMSFFTAYPDIFIDLISPEGCGIKLFFYQRIFLRAAMRF